MNQSISRPLNQSIKQSIEPINPRKQSSASTKTQSDKAMNTLTVSNKFTMKAMKSLPRNLKILTGCGLCLLILGIFLFLALPPLIHSQLIKQVTQQAVLGPDNQNLWAHYPGQSGTIITRNYTFFQLTNQQGFILHGQKPKFIQTEGYKIQQLQDYINIKFNQDKTKVKFNDWIHFQQFNQSRNLDQNVKILNVPGIGYWQLLKKSRDSIIFIQGFAIMFTNIQQTIIDTVVGQGISSQYLTDFTDTYTLLLQPAGISLQNSKFIWQDDGYGLNDTNNIKYWVDAAKNSFINMQPSFSSMALYLKDYFTLSDPQMYFIIMQFKQYIQSIQDLIIQNHYCNNIPTCNGHQLAIRQIASSYVTFNTPPVSTITPTDTICQNNGTCYGYYPQINSYYKNIYLVQHPKQDPFLKFDVQMVRKWLDYNPTGKQGEYSKDQSVLMHIGNLDALFNNGTQHDKVKRQHLDTTEYLLNIKNRFHLPSEQHTRVFWQWIKYLKRSLIRQQTPNNEKLGMANTFSSSIRDSFTYLQDNLQKYLLKSMLKPKLNSYSCYQFLKQSYQSTNDRSLQNICQYYNNSITSQQFIFDSILVCRNKYKYQWKRLIEKGATTLNLQAFCDKSVKNSWGQYYHQMRVQLNTFYRCDHTPNQYCSDYQLALKQWANSTVTLTQPPSSDGSLKPTTTFADWNNQATPFQYSHYISKFTDKVFPIYTIQQLYHIFNYDNIFSPPMNLRTLKNNTISKSWKDYMRYVILFIGIKVTTVRTPRQYILGYNDQYLLWRKNRYPPFGGDPSTPSYTAFNDLNLTSDQVALQIQLHTGKDNSSMSGQYYKINNLTYIAQNYTRFNGNQTYNILQSPWQQIDYFYGTNGKKFGPDQYNTRNISIYVPNLQRYGSAVVNYDEHYQRYGVQLQISKLGEYMYQPMQVNPENKKYYQHYHGAFNETSVLGFPFFMTSHYFFNSSDNWTEFIQIYNQKHEKVQPVFSHLQQSFVLYEPYSGVAFQSTLYTQANYFYEPDELFTNPQVSMLPVFTIYRSGNMTQQTSNKLFNPLNAALNAKIIFLIVGIVIAFCGLIMVMIGFVKIQNWRKLNSKDNYQQVSVSIKQQIQNPRNIINAQKQSVLTNPLMKSIEVQQVQ